MSVSPEVNLDTLFDFGRRNSSFLGEDSAFDLAGRVRYLIQGAFTEEDRQRFATALTEQHPFSLSTPIKIEPIAPNNRSTYVLKINDAALFVIKPCDQDPGTPNFQRRFSDYIPPTGYVIGSGPFTETIVNAYIRQCRDRIPGLWQYCSVPPTAYVQMNSLVQSGQLTAASVQKFIPHSHPLQTEDLGRLDQIFHPLALEFAAVMSILVVMGDQNMGNILVQNLPSGGPRLVLIDHGDSLREEGVGGKCCLKTAQCLQKTPSREIREFVQNLGGGQLTATANACAEEIRKNLSEEGLEETSRKMNDTRLLPHQIALRFTQKALQMGWTIAKILDATQKSARHENSWGSGNVIHAIYKKMRKNSGESLDALCDEIIFPPAEETPPPPCCPKACSLS